MEGSIRNAEDDRWEDVEKNIRNIRNTKDQELREEDRSAENQIELDKEHNQGHNVIPGKTSAKWDQKRKPPRAGCQVAK